MLTPDIKIAIEECVLCWLATVDSLGDPSVSPKEVFASYGDRYLLIANIASAGSVRNILCNPSVCVSLIDIFKQKGFKLRGRARIIQPGEDDYGEKLQPLLALAGPAFTIINIIEVDILQSRAIVAPRYLFYPATTEAEQMAAAMHTYGVTAKHLDKDQAS